MVNKKLQTVVSLLKMARTNLASVSIPLEMINESPRTFTSELSVRTSTQNMTGDHTDRSEDVQADLSISLAHVAALLESPFSEFFSLKRYDSPWTCSI